MGQYGDRLGFILKTADKLLISEKLILQDLDRNDLVVQNIMSLIDHRHASDADQLLYLISSVKTFACIFIHKIYSFQSFVRCCLYSAMTATVILSLPPCTLAARISFSISASGSVSSISILSSLSLK